MFLRKNWKLLLIVVLAVLLGLAIKRSVANRQKYLREKTNVESLMLEITHEKTKNGEDVTTIQELQLTVAELKKLRGKDLEKIKELGIRPPQIKEIVKTVIQAKIEDKDTLSKVSPGIFLWDKETEWWRVLQKIDFSVQPPSVDFNFTTTDSLTHILHKEPKFKILGIRFGTRGYKIKAVSSRPGSTILYNQWINVSREKARRNRE